MTAPDPRLDEIQAIPADAIEAAAKINYRPTGDVAVDADEWMTCCRDAQKALEAAHPVLLAELRKAHEALARIELACDAMDAGVAIRSGDNRTKSIAATTIRSIIWDSRAAVAAPKGDERG